MVTRIIEIKGSKQVQKFMESFALPQILQDRITHRNITDDKIQIIFALQNQEEAEWIDKIKGKK